MTITAASTTSMSDILLEKATEHLFPIWVELVLCCFSAVVYFLFSSKSVVSFLQPKPSRKMVSADEELLVTRRELSQLDKLTKLRKLGCLSKQISSTASSPRSSSAGDDVTQSSTHCSPQIDNTNKEGSNHGRTPNNVAMRANDIRSCGRNGNLNGAIKVFEKLGSHADNILVLNSMLDACVECQDLAKTEAFFERAIRSGVADTVTYNKMMKGYLAHGQEPAAKRLLAEMVQKGIANPTSYHGGLNARINAGDLRGAWKIVGEMQASGMSPNAVTCAILLKGTMQSLQELSRVLVLIDAMSEPMDEVLFMAVAEACVRVNRLDMLTKQLERFQRQGLTGLSAETYGSLIKAYGRSRDTKRVWELWAQMVAARSQLTSVTLGCMVEALVANGQSKEAWKLVKDMLQDQGTQPLVNTVICSSILKGFAYSKDAEKVMTIYKEMQAHRIQPNTITFNTILNAFAQCGTMHYAPELLADMKKTTPVIEPDIVTYSTLVKGYCYAGSLDRALQVFMDMQQEGKCAPDEVMFNSLLGGCAKEFRLEDALRLLDDMRKASIAPSNYTLSMLVKLMCRCRRLDQAFTMLDDISNEYNFKINIQVYTCLIQGCFFHGQTDKALAVYEKMINEGLHPDAMTYTVLARGCLRSGDIDNAVDLVRDAHGINAEARQIKGTPAGINGTCLEEVVGALGGASSKGGAALLSDLAEHSPKKQWQGY